MDILRLASLPALFRTMCVVTGLLIGGTASSDVSPDTKSITSMDVALDYGCSSAGCPNLDCTNKFLGAVSFYYGITAPQNTRMAYKAFQMAHECGDPRAAYFIRHLETHGHLSQGGG